MIAPALFSRASDEWATPRDLFCALREEFGGFDVDAAASRENTLCPLWFGPGGLAPDALALKDWRADDSPLCYWLNPPYSQCRAFMAKAACEAHEHGITVVCLVPSRTDTRWWHAHVWDGAAHRPRPGVEVRFLPGRLKFGDSTNSAPFPSAVIVFRPVAHESAG